MTDLATVALTGEQVELLSTELWLGLHAECRGEPAWDNQQQIMSWRVPADWAVWFWLQFNYNHRGHN